MAVVAAETKSYLRQIKRAIPIFTECRVIFAAQGDGYGLTQGLNMIQVPCTVKEVQHNDHQHIPRTFVCIRNVNNEQQHYPMNLDRYMHAIVSCS